MGRDRRVPRGSNETYYCICITLTDKREWDRGNEWDKWKSVEQKGRRGREEREGEKGEKGIV